MAVSIATKVEGSRAERRAETEDEDEEGRGG